MIARLGERYDLLHSTQAEVQTFLDDPFDPHAIAALRRIAYRKAIVMSYIDNVIDWGDMLFRQYSAETINEARMLYVLAHDLLGRRADDLGTMVLPEDTSYDGMRNPSLEDYEYLLQLENASSGDAVEDLTFAGTVHDTIVNNRYFFVPENELFMEYWNRVEDRLYKIRHCLNILGIEQPLPLFQPPVDPMALVRAVGAEASIAGAMASMQVAVPHYRFSFLVGKARDLLFRLGRFGGELQGILERRDAEALSTLYNRHEATILDMTRAVRVAQLDEATKNIEALQAGKSEAEHRRGHYDGLVKVDKIAYEKTQISLMEAASNWFVAGAVITGAGAVMGLLPTFYIGPFNFGASQGGREVSQAASGAGQAIEMQGEAVSTSGEKAGIEAQHERMKQEWILQRETATKDVEQIEKQIEAAELARDAASHEIALLDKQVEHNASIKTFTIGKFSNEDLYRWMASRMSGLYYQTYKAAYDMAKYAEKAFHFERGVSEDEASYIQPGYWDSQRKGLLAAESLYVDVDRMDQAFVESNRRRFEIEKQISLLALDPMALLQLRSQGVCEFNVSEALFDYDFPGHYCRQIKTVAITFDADIGPLQAVNATLTQLSHKTVMEPDSKAVKYLMQPRGDMPLEIRSDWRANQQLALSRVQNDHGLFELYFHDERYLPFEGTGAVSSWRLALNGRRSAFARSGLRDVIISMHYTALPGGDAFGQTVKGLLRPYPTARFFSLAEELADEWERFLGSDDDELTITLTRDQFPNMASSKITGIFTHYELYQPGPISMVLNGESSLTFAEGTYLITTGLSIKSEGSEWKLAVQGDKSNLRNMYLVVGYKAKVD